MVSQFQLSIYHLELFWRTHEFLELFLEFPYQIHTQEGIVENPSVKAVSFTGSTRVGKLIAKTCGEQMKKVSLELGGKNPFIITENANIEAAVSTAMRAAFTNQGQVCLCGSRIYIHESIYNQVKTQLIEKLKTLIPSDPKEKSSRFGSLTSKSHFDKVNNYLEMAKRDPSIKLHLFDHNIQFGNFISPALLENVPPDHAINQEEIFGPIATLQSYSSEDELINLANNTEYGLCASIYSQDKDQAKRLASKIEAGIVWINTWLERDLRTPFGGAKASGFGREGGNYALNFFTETKNICIPEEK